MHLHETLVILLMSSINFINGAPLTDVTYEELEELNATCHELDNCKMPRNWTEDSLATYTCHCNSFCVSLDTCCVDSPYRGLKQATLKPSCRSVFGQNWLQFIVDKCPNDTESIFKGKCENEWNEIDHIITQIPVTSLHTKLNYKNYFCFKCHEDHDGYLYWNIRFSPRNESDVNVNATDITPSYNSANKTWMASVGEGSTFIPINLEVEMPEEISNLSKACLPDVISTCSENWEDSDVEIKCQTYTSIVNFTTNGTFLRYKNPHCAICNFENLNKMGCTEVAIHGTRNEKPFSFSLMVKPFIILLDSDDDEDYISDDNDDYNKVGRVKVCNDDSTWDPFFKKCRRLLCVLPGYVVENGKCTAP